MFDVHGIRRQFPLLSRADAPVYLDTAATAQKPQCVLDAMNNFYQQEYGNARRGMHPLAESASVALEKARTAVQHFVRARHAEEIIFTKSATESLNMIALSLGKSWGRGDVIALSTLEHHSNIVPWQMLAAERGVQIVWIPCNEEGHVDLAAFDAILEKGNVRLVNITAQSNVLGVRPPLEEIISRAHNVSALICVDAAQAIAHEKIDVQELGCDLLAFSGHKLYGPTGIGVLYGKRELLEKMPPVFGGGGMVQEVTPEGFMPDELPMKFESGTPAVAEAVGLAAAIGWMESIGWKDVETHEHALIMHAAKKLDGIDGLKRLGPMSEKELHGCVSFVIEGVHPHDLTEILGKKGFCLRAGHHCAAPLHQHLNIPASTRLSVGIYNTAEEIDACVSAIGEAVHFLRGS